jgi:hypothetical protein
MPTPLQQSPIIFTPAARPPIGIRRPYGVAVGGLAPVPFDIPVCWLTPPVTLRMEQPYTTAAVSRDGGGTYRDVNTGNRDEYGDFQYTADLATFTDRDPANLAHWTVTYRSVPRTRCSQIVVNLMFRTDTERVALLRIPRWSRIQLTGVPPEFPEGANSLVVAGTKHQISLAGHLLYFTTGPVIGAVAGVPGPWFRYGSSSWGGTDVIPF